MNATFSHAEYKPATPRQRRVLKIVGYVFLLLSPLWFFGAASCYQSAQEVLETWQRAEATVIALKPDDSVYYPRFRFTANGGRSYVVTGSHGSSDPAYGVGDSIPILYPAENPAKAEENSFFSLYLTPIVLAAFGSVDFLIGCLALWMSRRKDLKTAD